jgi:RND family efflux transporter MFP subunit
MTPSQRFRWRFRLSTLLILVAVLGLGFKLFTERVNKLKKGDRVRAGDLLAEFVDGVAKAQLEVAQTELNWADFRRRTRAKTTGSETGVSDAKFKLDLANAGVDAAKAECAAAEHQLADTKIRAPFDSTVIDVFTERDTRINPFDRRKGKLFELADLSGFVARRYVPENQWMHVRKGQRARVEMASGPNAQYLGEVIAIDRRVDLNTGVFGITVSIQPALNGDLLIAGMSVRVSLETEAATFQRIGSMILP